MIVFEAALEVARPGPSVRRRACVGEAHPHASLVGFRREFAAAGALDGPGPQPENPGAEVKDSGDFEVYSVEEVCALVCAAGPAPSPHRPARLRAYLKDRPPGAHP